jgi:hypothetical protein
MRAPMQAGPTKLLQAAAANLANPKQEWTDLCCRYPQQLPSWPCESCSCCGAAAPHFECTWQQRCYSPIEMATSSGLASSPMNCSFRCCLGAPCICPSGLSGGLASSTSNQASSWGPAWCPSSGRDAMLLCSLRRSVTESLMSCLRRLQRPHALRLHCAGLDGVAIQRDISMFAATACSQQLRHQTATPIAGNDACFHDSLERIGA